jgi:hypothetical protein
MAARLQRAATPRSQQVYPPAAQVRIIMWHLQLSLLGAPARNENSIRLLCARASALMETIGLDPEVVLGFTQSGPPDSGVAPCL